MPTTQTPTPLHTRSTTELLRLARATRPDVARESLKVLSRRRSPSAPRLARDLVLHHADQHVRAAAAVVLGRSRETATQETLLIALHDDDPIVLRRVAQSLGRIGDIAALRALQAKTVAEDTPVGRAVATARTLLSYRLGVTDHLVDPARTGLASFRVAGGVEIKVGTRLRRPRSSVAADAARELPGLGLDPRAVLAFECSGQPGALVAAEVVTSAGAPTEVFAQPLLAGALLRDRPCSERYSLDAYVLVDDRNDTGGTKPELWLMRPDGTVLHHGKVIVTGTSIEFIITGSNAPYSRPVRIMGAVNRGRGTVAISTAIVGPWRPGTAKPTDPQARAVALR